jgi:hypothetical protein
MAAVSSRRSGRHGDESRHGNMFWDCLEDDPKMGMGNEAAQQAASRLSVHHRPYTGPMVFVIGPALDDIKGTFHLGSRAQAWAWWCLCFGEKIWFTLCGDWGLARIKLHITPVPSPHVLFTSKQFASCRRPCSVGHLVKSLKPHGLPPRPFLHASSTIEAPLRSRLHSAPNIRA